MAAHDLIAAFPTIEYVSGGGDIVTLSEVKEFAQYDSSDQDTLWSTLITAATEELERATERRFITTTLKMYLDHFPAGVIEIPVAPVQSVSSIQYVDQDDVTQTVTSTIYQVDTSRTPARICTEYDQWWPWERSQTVKAVTINLVAGYGDTMDDVPSRAKLAVMMAAKSAFDGCDGDGSRPLGYQSLVHSLSWRPVI